MRATATPSPSRNGKRRLFESCAIAAGLMALAYGGPALAQVAGSGTVTNLPGGTTGNTGANPSTVNVTGSQNIVTWTPSNAPVDGVIDFLPSGNTLNFVGDTSGYIVLNRFTSASGASITDQIALNGTVNSYVGATTGPRGGNIWFQNAGGVLIGSSGVINVGSLVLTSNDIDTTGGLLGPGNTIRFRGAPGSTASVNVFGAINANNDVDPGSSYVALVAPRVVQAGAVRVDGSAAYVAAEQADIRINNGLFDINVLVGAEGGNVITHTGSTTGPAHQQGDIDQSRIYMVAIPKNDAVTMLVSGQIGYDDALSAQVDPDGAVRLSAGYNVTGGELDAAPVSATAANIAITDTLFRSDTVAHASGNLVGEPVQVLPPPVLPFVPPPQQGRILVQGNGTFIGDASATFNVNAGRAVGATGNFTVQSGGANGVPGNASVNVNGGQFGVGGNLDVSATGVTDAATGDSTGGTARLDVNSGGLAIIAGTTTVAADGAAGTDAGGSGGDGRGGTAGASVSGTGSVLSTAALIATAIGTGGGLTTDPVSGTSVADVGGDGFGGTATVLVENGGSLSTSIGVSAVASGQGQIGLTQSGDGQGGTAGISVTGPASSFQAPTTIVVASGNGGGNISSPTLGTFTTLAGGNGVGGQVSITIGADPSSTIDFGNTSIGAVGGGGDAAGENSAGGQGEGGTASIAGTGDGTVQFNDVAINASATGGGATSPSAQTASSGDAVGGVINVTATVGTTLAINGDLGLTATGVSATADNIGGGTGGSVAVSVESGANIDVNNLLIIDTFGGSFGPPVFAQSAGSGTGGDVDLTAIGGGAIRADGYLVDAGAGVVNVSGASGAAQGGTIDVSASTGGQILVTNDSNNFFDTSAVTGVSAAGSSATGGTVQFIANGGTIDMGLGANLAAGGVSGGAINPGPNNPVGRGGTILVQLVAEPTGTSTINVGDFDAAANGLTAVDVEGSPAIPRDTAGSGQGGDISFDVQGGTLTAASINASANGYGGGTAGGAGGALGSGGTASFTQTGGTVNTGDMTISADGFGGTALGQSGEGQGGTATINLNGGTITAADIVATADGLGGDGSTGDDDDPANVVPGGLGGAGQGGAATINIGGTAVVDASIILAQAIGTGGAGGEFFNASSFGGSPGTPGNGGGGTGGNATVNVTGGTTTASSMIADASGIGGSGGNSFFSSSSGGATSVGVGGTGGTGQGGAATMALASAIAGVGSTSSVAQGVGGAGGNHNVGGDGGDGFGGLAQAIVANFDAGELAIAIDSTGLGGNGGGANDGAGGDGGDGSGGVSRFAVQGDASATAVETNFTTTGIGGNGGSAQLGFGSFELAAPSGGNGGDGRGGTIEIAANEGGAVTLGLVDGSAVILGNTGIGGNGGNGANSVFDPNAVSGDGGFGGGGSGGTVRLVTNGGTISSNGEAVAINVGGISGIGGSGGIGNGGGADGAGGGSFGTAGGRVAIEAFNGLTGPGAITLGDTQISANGDIAGRIELRAEGNIDFLSLDAEAAGFADPTNNDTDVAPAGIFLAMNGGTISSQGGATLTTDSSVGVYAQSNGMFDVGGILTINAVDQIDIRHDFREGIAPTIRASGDLTATAGGISGGPGSLLASGGALSLNSTLGAVGVDQLDAVDIIIGAAGAAAVEHAEAINDFTATGASFRTGLNSIITGGDIIVSTPGTVDLGNSTAGGFVSVSGQSIVFNMIGAGSSVFLSANDDVPGALGISGGSIDAGGNVDLSAARIAITGTVSGTGSLFANGNAGPVAINLADFDGPVSISASGNISGTYNSGGDIRLNSGADINAAANAIGSQSSSSGPPIAASVFAEAAGDIVLANSSASGMFGANAGGSVSLASVTAGEDLLVRSGNLATLANVGAGDDLTVLSGGDIIASGLVTTGAGPDGQTLFYNDDPVSFVGFGVTSSAPDGANIALAATNGSIAANSGNASGSLTVTAGGGVTSTGLLQSGQATTVTGGSLALGSITAGTDIAITANVGDFTASGTLIAGHDIGIAAVDAVDAAGLDAGDDIRVANGGDATIGNAFSRGTGLDNEGDGSNIALSAGMTRVDHAEADNDFTADVAGFSTGLDSIITGGDIVVISATGVDLGNSTAGGLVSAGGETIAFNSITAGTTVSLNATGIAGTTPEIDGGSVAAGGDINLSASRIAIDGPVTGGAGLFAFGSGTVAIGQADISGDIVISAGGDLTGSYISGGNILLTSGANITASAVANGGYVGPNGISEGYLFADADGNATLANSSAATMFGVRAGQAASIGNATAGEDMFVTAGSNTTLGNITAGDDITAIAAGSISANGLTTTGTGPDGRSVIYGPLSAGIDALQITTSAADQSNIALTASTGNITGSAMDAFDNLTLTAAGAIATAGSLRSGQATSIVGRDVLFDAIDAGTAVGISASGTATGAEGIRGIDIGADDNIILDGNSIAITGTVEGDASLFATATGGTAAIAQADLAGNIAISAGGNLTGTYAAGGNISLNAGGNVDASATAGGTTADGNLFVDAGGNVVLANSAAARMFGINAGGSAAIAGGTAGEDMLVRTGTTASLANVTAGDDVEIRAGGNVTANNVSATGTGADTRLLSYMPGSGFTIMQGEGTSSVDGSDVRIASANGSINAATLSAGDDISLVATGGNATLSDAATLGLGVTGGSSDISVEAVGATLAGLNSADDVLVTTSRTTNVDGAIVADRDIAITAGAVNLAMLTTPGGNPVDTLAAGRNIGVAAADDISGGRINAVGDITLTSAGAIEVAGIFGNNVAVDGATGITADQLFAVGTTTLSSNNGAIALNTLVSSGNIDASADSIVINGGSMIFSTITTDVGDAIVSGGDLFVIDGNIAGHAEFSSSGERLGITTLTARSAALEASGGFMTLDSVNVADALSATARTSLDITGTVTGQSIALASADIDIASTGRIGTAGTTGAVSIANNNPDNQTFVGGTGTANGYHIDAGELTRVFGSDVEIFAPEVAAAGGGSVGSAAPPDVVVDSFVMTGGGTGSNLGASGQLTIRTPGKMRVVGNVELTGLTEANALNLFAGEALEVILGQGSVRLINSNAPAGQLNLASEDIIVATAAAIADVGAAATTDAIEARLAQNDGVLLDEGALFARGIRAEVVGGFYVQNSGAGTRFAERRGMTFGAGGLDVLTEGPSRIVINGVHLGPNGQVTGLDTIPLLTIAGGAPSPGSFDPRSTFNGCLIAATGACNLPTEGGDFPIQDVIEEEIKADEDGQGDGNTLPQSLITMRDLDPLSGEPLLDDPVTGAGNDDLWTPELDSCDPGSASGGTCPAAK